MGFAWVPPRAAPAIFAARNNALLLGLGVMVGACRLLGRGRGFAGASALVAEAPLAVPLVLGAVPLVLGTTPLVLGAMPFVLGTALVDLGAGRRDGRGPVPVDILEVVRERAGREGAAAEGGREMTGRAEDVPLKDCRDDDREGRD